MFCGLKHNQKFHFYCVYKNFNSHTDTDERYYFATQEEAILKLKELKGVLSSNLIRTLIGRL